MTLTYRWAETYVARLPALAKELVDLKVACIVAIGSTLAARSAKSATADIPIIFSYAGDPVHDGLVASMNAPNGNLTGVADLNTALGGKRLSLLRDLVPGAKRFGFLSGAPVFHTYKQQKSDILAAADALGLEIIIQEVRGEGDYDTAMNSLVQRKAEALLVGSFTFNNLPKLLGLIAKRKIPTLYPRRIFVDLGGLMSYAASDAEVYRQVGAYAGRILKGTTPADLPVVQPTKFTLAINLRTAKTLALEVPPILLNIADEVIE